MTRWLDEQELRAWKGFCLMQMQLFALLAREMTEGLSETDYSVLAGLSDQPDRQLRLTELGQQLGWEKSRVSHHVARMEQRGLVEKLKCPTDQRGWFVRMTPTGLAAITAAAPRHVELVRAHFIDLLTPGELAALASASEKVLAHLPSAP